MIEWKPYDELKITPEMENQSLLLYVTQVKLCSRIQPEVITADIINGEVHICSVHRIYSENDIRLSKITHYAFLNTPYDT
jgi:hypothetical protein